MSDWLDATFAADWALASLGHYPQEEQSVVVDRSLRRLRRALRQAARSPLWRPTRLESWRFGVAVAVGLMGLVFVSTYLIEVLVDGNLAIRWPDPTAGVLVTTLMMGGPIYLGLMHQARVSKRVRETADRLAPNEWLLFGVKAAGGTIVLATDRRLVLVTRERHEHSGEARRELKYSNITAVAIDERRSGESTATDVTVTAGESRYAIALSTHEEARALIGVLARRTELLEPPTAPRNGTFLMRRVAWFSLLPLGVGAWAPVYAGYWAGRRRWQWCGMLWSALTLAGWIISSATTKGSHSATLGGAFISIGWLGSALTMLIIRKAYLRRIAPWLDLCHQSTPAAAAARTIGSAAH